jgi:hypothetical protein
LPKDASGNAELPVALVAISSNEGDLDGIGNAVEEVIRCEAVAS